MVEAGQKAPEFTLQDQNDESVSLTDFKGKKVLVYFYPRASTPGCTVQACALRDTKSELDELNVVILGISPDTPKKLTNFTNKQELNFTLLADEDHAVCEAYGVWQLKKFMGRENMGVVRTSFLVDENGNIEHVFNKFKTKDHHEVVLNYLNRNL
ncbi:thioredoxin-dependent thiol peroxidase [Alteromonas macleodii]|uniref:thioredoxin-dependent thiol peroxidase n=1 Tax=Alteromonas macleodii TaxID=28108 RepID=UPI001286BE4A|nr:thioredoxin-dependent thiol peroxidase [Alteromonas macleodii]CAI2390223.1 peroxiredoxin Q/BCP [Alteromonas macleodii]CAI3957994.1 peroxiredoxin Q/BCP [Alteromonas macleodii]CAI3959001.1 peroxiredoxin Q/BCP [Alteromonas macleodii]CAI3959008.1 peroxiredoxin Q/BCP [Alteromonas macleodii]VTO39819.1 peroxiredoxin Q/BCP [Alteromonas macleodii]|tara:strand:- start:1273 stop:1737 length:465 start_codon:yes stop_codon:yes gene_type:complete